MERINLVTNNKFPLKGGEKMQIIGTGSGSISLSFRKLPIKLAKGDFYQVLSQFGNQVGSKQDFGDSRQNAKDSKSQNKLLQFQESNEPPLLNGEDNPQNPFVSDSNSNILQLIYRVLEVENPNSSDIHANAIQNSNGTTIAGNTSDEICAMNDRLPSLLPSQASNYQNKDLLSLFQTDNTNLDSNTTEKTSRGFPQTVINQMEEIGQDHYSGSGLKYFKNLLSHAITQENVSTINISKTSNLNLTNSIMDWIQNNTIHPETEKISNEKIPKQNISRQNSRDSTIEMVIPPFKENSSNPQVTDRNKLILSLQAGNKTLPQEESSTNTESVQAPAVSLNLYNLVKLYDLLSTMKNANGNLPQVRASTTIDNEKDIHNVFDISGQQVSSAAVAGDQLSEKTTAEIPHGRDASGRQKTETMMAEETEPASLPLSQPNENILPLKGVLSNDQFISNKRIGDMQVLGGSDEVNSNLQGNAQFSNIPVSQRNLINRFSQIVKEINSNTKPDMVAKTSNITPASLDLRLNSSVFVQPMSKIEQFVLMTQGSKEAPVTVENMIQQFESILGKSQFSKTGGMQKLLIQLHPKNLGSLRIELIQKDQTTIARILTTTDAAKEALESHLHSLKDAFTAQNIPINKVEIETQASPSQQERFPNSEQQQQRNNHSNQQKQHKNDNEDETESTFTLSLDVALLNKKV